MKRLIAIILALQFTTINAFAQKEHFGMILGSRYDTGAVSWEFFERYGTSADSSGTGNFYQIRVYSNCSKEGGTFGQCTIDFYKGRFWKIVYEDIINDSNDFANRLERKYMKYSISETNFEYQYGNIYFEFDGNRLRYVDESVSRSMLSY